MAQLPGRAIGLSSVLVLCASPAQAQGVTVPGFTEVSTAEDLSGFYSPSTSFALGVMDMRAMAGGVAVGDFNGDGWQDIFSVTGGAFPDKLFINDGDGSFSEMAASAGVAMTHMGMGACAGDYDRDGDLDIYVTSLGASSGSPTTGQHLLWRNNGDLTFENVAIAAGVNETSASVHDGLGSTFGDYDLDGDLDLFVAGWVPDSSGNRLFRNEGNGTFTDVTVSSGVHDLEVHGFSPQFLDMDGDHYPELLIAADFGTSRYYVNNGDGTFSESTLVSGLGRDGNGMGQCTGDFDGDGRFDWYVTSIYSLNSGAAYIPGTGNMLYLNNGQHSFSEVSVAAGVNDGGWGWGAVAADFNHDGTLDLAETNGFKHYNADSILEWEGEPSYLWLNTGGASFVEVHQQAGFNHTYSGRGLVRLDYDNDGDQDLVVVANGQRLKLFRNDLTGPDTHWLRVELDTSASPYLAPAGLGARIVCSTPGLEQVRCVDSGCSYLSTSEQVAHFGLGAATSIPSLRVEWSNGRVTYLQDVAVDQALEVAFCPGDWNGQNGVTPEDYRAFRNDWSAGGADFNGDQATDMQDYVEFLAAYQAGCP